MVAIPVLDELRNASSPTERAIWLLRAPLALLYRDHMAIRNVLLAVQDDAAIAALDAELAAMLAVRDQSGTQPETIRFSTHYHRAVLAGAVREARDHAAEHDKWGHE